MGGAREHCEVFAVDTERRGPAQSRVPGVGALAA
ncbi:hypothetical protein STAFG_2622 [Streptomyces afghaniensis 772]|uniref:Uncharacterized protein n=1 Tax=Streptomyces afghaniensis 772 TaxID=1283301 RepID=S4N165_9ACTN|nr:hypothetical protein STAFG_2622 [Streptomyces afghaniensis 772]